MTIPSSHADWIVTLVHGTWGRGFLKPDSKRKSPRWFEEGSDFRGELIQELEALHVRSIKIEICRWSGSNSIASRERAARHLGAQLSTQVASNPDAKQLVIAHSHGGNVAIRALQHLDDGVSSLLIATLATPFLEIFPRTLQDVSLDDYLMRLISFFLFNVAGVLYLTGTYWPPIPFYPIFIAYFAFGLFGMAFETSAKRRISRALLSMRLARFTSHAGLLEGRAELLVLRGVNDEAALSIATGTIGRRLAKITNSLMGSVMGWILFICLLVPLSLAAGWLLLPQSFMGTYTHHYLPSGVAVLAATNAISVLVILICYVASAACHVVHGRELFMSFYNPQISTNSVPDASGPITVHTLIRKQAYATKGFRHRLYNEDGCTMCIASWANARFASKPLVPSIDERRGYVTGMRDLQERQRLAKLRDKM